MTATNQQQFDFMIGILRDLNSARTSAHLNLIVTQAKAQAWRLNMGGTKRHFPNVSPTQATKGNKGNKDN